MTAPRQNADAKVTIDPPGGKVIRGELAGGPAILLSRDAILKANDLATEDVDVPEWGGTVRARGLDGTSRDEFEASMLVPRGNQMVNDTYNIRAKLVARCLIDENGELMFSQQDVAALGLKSGAALARIFEVCSRLSGLSDDDVAELEGNSGSDAEGGSTST